MTTDHDSLRRRTAASTTSAKSPDAQTDGRPKTVTVKDETYRVSVLDVLRAVLGLALAGLAVAYLLRGSLPRPWWTKPHLIRAALTPALELTNAQLAAYDGNDPDRPILLAINRTIYDVSSSRAVYGPGGAYSKLAAKDASRSYVTTCFDPVHDLVPYLGGVEEIYVPIWLSHNPPQDELDQIAEGEVIRGMGIEKVIEQLKLKIGRKKVKQLQKEAYDAARERVRAQIKTWEGMFAKKEYPIVGRVVGVDDSDKKLWRDLRFCKEATAQRPPISDSLGRAMELMTGSEKIDLSKMAKSGMGNVMGQAQDKAARKEARKMAKEAAGKGKKSDAQAKEKVQQREKDAKSQPAPDGDTAPLDEEQQGIAQASVEDMLKGGKFGGERNKA